MPHRMPSVADRSSDVDLPSAGLSLCLFSQSTRPVNVRLTQVVPSAGSPLPYRYYQGSSIVAYPHATYDELGGSGGLRCYIRNRCGDTTSTAAYIVF